jgi:hypothetical protein
LTWHEDQDVAFEVAQVDLEGLLDSGVDVVFDCVLAEEDFYWELDGKEKRERGKGRRSVRDLN